MSVQKIPIEIKDTERKTLGDKFSFGEPGNTIRGRVRIFERKVGEGKKLYLVEDTSNLIVYRGRNWMVQRAFNADLTSRPGWKDKYISWLAVGGGGATADPLIPESPVLEDYQLGNQLPIGAGTRYINLDGYHYHMFDDNYPTFLYDTDIDNNILWAGCTQVDTIQGITRRCDGFLIGLVKTTIAADECNGSSYQDINEAGLFVGPSSPAANTDLQLFSRVCFSTIRKDSSRELIFSWYIYF
jgi:hypothetical protein